jgi:hypothetical protein
VGLYAPATHRRGDGCGEYVAEQGPVSGQLFAACGGENFLRGGDVHLPDGAHGPCLARLLPDFFSQQSFSETLVLVTYPVISFRGLKPTDTGRYSEKKVTGHERKSRERTDDRKNGFPRKYLYRDAQSRHTQICIRRFGGGTVIPRTSTAAKAGNPAGTETETVVKAQQEAFDLEKKKMELEKERATLQFAFDKQQAEAERDLFKAALERERAQAASALEQAKRQNEVFAKVFARPSAEHPDIKTGTDAAPGYVTELVGYHAMKRISSDITRALSSIVGQGNDVRIMIVDRLDYATGDIPFIEVTSQLSVFEVRCRKQVAINKELADLTLQVEGQEENEKTPAVKSGSTRLAPLAISPFILPGITTAETTVPQVTGIAGTSADIAGISRNDYSSDIQNGSLKTEGLMASVAGSLRSEKRYIYIYNFYSMDTTGPQSKLMNMYAGVLDCSSRLAQSRNRLLYAVSKKTGLLAELKTSLMTTGLRETSATQQQEIADIREEIRRETGWLDRAHMEVLASDAIHRELGTFVKNITLADALQPASKLAQAVFREKVHELGITHLLYLGVLSSGGESVTRKWIFGTGTTSYMGGAVVSYVLSRAEGDVLASDTLPVMYSFGFDPAGQRHSSLKQIRFEKQEPKK